MKTKAVAIHMSLHTNHRLEIAQGIVQYAREHPDWRLYGRFYTSQPVKDYGKWNGNGIISICHNREDAAEIMATGLPIVDVVEGFLDNRIVYVTTDNLEAGKMGGRHLLETGFSSFAYCDIAGVHWSRLRLEGFAETVGVALDKMPVFSRSLAWWQNPWRSRSLESFLAALPERTAILSGNDTVGVKVTVACTQRGRKIPDDIAVMGLEGDNLLCELSTPTLSTIHVNGKLMGYEAARCLDALMRDKNAPRRNLHIPPGELIIRASTDIMADGDAAVRRAVMYIRQNYTSQISVADVTKQAAVCRRSLEMRFRRHLGRTVLEEIHAARMHGARRLLEETDLPVSKILSKCGFLTHQFFYTAFAKQTGMTPAQYRKKRKEIQAKRFSVG